MVKSLCMNKDNIALLLLAGNGQRMFNDIHVKKQFYQIEGKELFLYSLDSLISAKLFKKIVLVIDKEDEDSVKRILNKDALTKGQTFIFAYGGKDRNASVFNGLLALKEEKNDFTLFIHDSARPLLPLEVLIRLEKASLDYDAITPVIPIHDSLIRDGKNITYINRDQAYRVLTPQVFDYRKLMDIYEKGYDSHDTDDYMKALKGGLSHTLVRGDASMFKVTEIDDLRLIESIIKKF